MSDFAEMAEAYEIARRAPDPMDRAAATAELARLDRISTVCAQMQGEGSDDCEECGVEIPQARRAAAPWAVCCVDCAAIRERRGA
jgi:phage/conjugal plasmid C-4 type zinc finger TraR family protein